MHARDSLYLIKMPQNFGKSFFCHTHSESDPGVHALKYDIFLVLLNSIHLNFFWQFVCGVVM